jgi:hypothetical protein
MMADGESAVVGEYRREISQRPENVDNGGDIRLSVALGL